MIKVNLKKITLNESKMKAIANAAQSDRLKNYYIEAAQKILNETRHKIPYNANSSKPHLKDLYQVSKPMKKSFKIQGQKYPSIQVKIKPKGKYKTYYGVVTAGVRNKKQIQYSNPMAESYFMEKALKNNKLQIEEDSINLLLKEIGDINDN